jgi:hypothetical protein
MLAVLGLALFRVLVPLAALAASGHQLPRLPLYRYRPLNGDANGFYSAARELISAATRVPRPLAGALVVLLVCSVAAGVALWRRLPSSRWIAVAVPLLALSLAASAAIHEMSPPGAAVIGWSLVWAVPMLPFRAMGVLDPDAAFALGLVLSLLAVAVTTVAVAAIGVLATGRRAVGLTAAGLWALWPFLPALVVGDKAWENGQWNVDVGLHLYTEPLSTALVAVTVALLLARQPTTSTTGIAGLLAGLATLVKLSNGLIAAVVLPVIVLRHGRRHAVSYAACALVSMPMVIAYWPKGYVGQFDGQIAAVDHPFALDYAWRSWRDSLVFSPRMLLVLLPLALVGVVAVRGRAARALLVLPVVVTAAFYSFYYVTALHPRFLYVTLPLLLTLEAAGAVSLAGRLRRPSPARAPAKPPVRDL